MTQDSFVRKLEEMLERDPLTLTPATALDDLGWDSLAVVSFLALADEQVGAQLRPRDVSNCKNVGDLLALLGDRLGERTAG